MNVNHVSRHVQGSLVMVRVEGASKTSASYLGFWKKSKTKKYIYIYTWGKNKHTQ